MKLSHWCKTLESQVANLFSRLERDCSQMAIAESCTGGLLGGTLTAQPGSSKYFKGGIIAYDNRVKQSILGVAHELLESSGAVSREVAAQMARGAARLFKTDLGLATTGIAGPGGATADKPVGLVYTAVCYGERLIVKKHRFSGKRRHVRCQTVSAIIDETVELLEG